MSTRGNTVFSTTNGAFKPHKQSSNLENMHVTDRSSMLTSNLKSETVQGVDKTQSSVALTKPTDIHKVNPSFSNKPRLSIPNQVH